MLILVGLGNPGIKYKNNRHNVGQLFIDFIAPLLHCSIVKKEKMFITMKQSNNETITLAKPQTFMNNSGVVVKKLVSHYSLIPNRLIVLHDDLDIPLGKFHIQFASGPQLHNGIESVEQHLKTKDFWRVRIGVDARPALRSLGEGGRIPGKTYALQNFLPEEKMLLETKIFPKIFIQLKLHLKNQFQITI